MTAQVLIRPVWRRFRPRFLARAVDHVRAGGHAAIAHEDGEIDVLLTVDAAGQLTELGQWALLTIEHERWRKVTDGPAEGLATARIERRFIGSVLDWCTRDSIHEGPTREITLDCLECAACCHDAKVVLEDGDLDRWRAAGREELGRRPYVRRARDGKVSLRFGPGGRCRHLQTDRRCAIYELRPFNCSVFLMGSEACLIAREETLGIRDGAPWEP